MRKEVKRRYRLYRRARGVFYCLDAETGKRESLKTKDSVEAQRLVDARNEAGRNPYLNLQLARVYLSAADPVIGARTWADVMKEIVETKHGENQRRWSVAVKDKAFDSIRTLPIVETRAEQLLQVLKVGTVSTNVYLRRIHNFSVEMNWLAWPILPKRKWPVVRHGEKRAITKDEHERILERENNPERRAFYALSWHIGASQTDIANLSAEDVDWSDRTISFERVKVKWRGGPPPIISIGKEVEAILNERPKTGPLFPYLRTVRSSDRATEFKQRCSGLKIVGVTLHCYRYAWAQRAKQAGMPERFAMQVLGHGSKAVHRAYARKAQVRVPSLEEYERQAVEGKVIPMPKIEPPAPTNVQAASSI